MKYVTPVIISTQKAKSVLGSSAAVSSFTGMKGSGEPDNGASLTDSSAYTANS